MLLWLPHIFRDTGFLLPLGTLKCPQIAHIIFRQVKPFPSSGGITDFERECWVHLMQLPSVSRHYVLLTENRVNKVLLLSGT